MFFFVERGVVNVIAIQCVAGFGMWVLMEESGRVELLVCSSDCVVGKKLMEGELVSFE